ncbi:MAG TPA: hypothetical protein VFL51_01435 [Pseudolabrys sp.]|nr:hypothetical protein [Pseudolabrys sp.]
MVREGPAEPAPPRRETSREQEPAPYPAEKARGAAIILRTRGERLIFIIGLVGLVILALLLWAFAG